MRLLVLNVYRPELKTMTQFFLTSITIYSTAYKIQELASLVKVFENHREMHSQSSKLLFTKKNNNAQNRVYAPTVLKQFKAFFASRTERKFNTLDPQSINILHYKSSSCRQLLIPSIGRMIVSS